VWEEISREENFKEAELHERRATERDKTVLVTFNFMIHDRRRDQGQPDGIRRT
jgi:hypothetical protein